MAGREFLNMPLEEAMRTQRAIRRLKPDPVDDELMLHLIELALKAPTGGNAQNWEFVMVKAADRRFRALMMTALVDGLGLLPAALSTRIGAQTQRPLAIVVIGGAISIALLTRVFQPTLVYVLHNYIGLTDDRKSEAGGEMHS